MATETKTETTDERCGPVEVELGVDGAPKDQEDRSIRLEHHAARFQQMAAQVKGKMEARRKVAESIQEQQSIWEKALGVKGHDGVPGDEVAAEAKSKMDRGLQNSGIMTIGEALASKEIGKKEHLGPALELVTKRIIELRSKLSALQALTMTKSRFGHESIQNDIQVGDEEMKFLMVLLEKLI